MQGGNCRWGNTGISETTSYKLTRDGAFLVLGGLPIDRVRMVTRAIVDWTISQLCRILKQPRDRHYRWIRFSAKVSASGGVTSHCSAPMEAPVRPHGFNDHHLGKVLARKQADEDPLGIGDSQRRCLRSVEPVKHGLKSRRTPHHFDRRTHKSRDSRLAVVTL